MIGMGQLCCKRPRADGIDCLEMEGPRAICNISTSTVDIRDHPLDISSTATPCRIRLVDCQALTEEDILRIVEFPLFPTTRYSAISYPWRGVDVDSSFTGHTFAVRGAEHADPVGIDALRHACTASLLRGAHPSTRSYNDIPFWRPQRKVLAPNVSALSIALDPVLTADPDTRAHAVWQSALMRTSSRPVDMVFSIMGLFDVTLDPAQFHKDDRRGATIALAQAILRNGGSASWLAVGFRLEPDRSLSTFPTFPRTSVAGVALVQRGERVQEVSELVDPVYPVAEALVPLPKGSMDDAGYFTFTARAVPLRPVESGPEVLIALDQSRWAVPHEASERAEGNSNLEVGHVGAYGVLVGWFNRYYPGQTSAFDKHNIRVMLLEEHQAGMAHWHVRSYFTLCQTDRAYVLGWTEREFRVGGPEEAPPLPQPSQPGADIVANFSEEATVPWPWFINRRPVQTLDDEVAWKARWAVPQRVLERYRPRKEV